MKAKHIFSVITFLLSILIFLLVLTNFDPPAAYAKDTSTVALQQATSTPQANDAPEEIGSTDGILIMGVVIVLIVTLPVIFRKRK